MQFFKAQFIPHFAFLLIFPALISLGFWQMERASTKKAWIKTLQQDHIIPLALALNDPKSAQYQKTTLEGEFINSDPLLLMHQSLGNQHGVHVINLFKIIEKDALILVNRGFLNNSNLQNIATPPGQSMTLHGIIDLPKPDRFILGKNILDPTLRPLPIQRLDVQELETLLGTPLLPVVILADQDLGDGMVRRWEMTPNMPPEKHMAYAVQWFALALCLIIIYMYVNLKRPS